MKTRASINEVIATYSMGEVSMELVVRLATNHPLRTVIVETGQRIGVPIGQWRHWILQMTTYLSNQVL